MTAPGFNFHTRLSRTPESWSALDISLARWVLTHGGRPELAHAVGWASLVDARGDSALMLRSVHAHLPGLSDAEGLARALDELADQADNGWISRPGADDAIPDTAFVLDQSAFYLRRNYIDETAVARALRARLNALPDRPAPGIDCNTLFDADPGAHQIPQRDAVQAALGRRLFLLSGGPGTGKTATVLRLLLACTRQFQQQHGHSPRLHLAAPTGKAAQRMNQALREGIRQLGALANHWVPELAEVQNAEAGTLHRLLGSRGLQGGFRHHAGQPLDTDLVVVDEASMIDLALLRALLDALPPQAALILVGDPDQLAPVGTGSALSDLVTALQGRPSLARLEHSFRANQALNRINQAVRQGQPEAFAQALSDAGRHAAQKPTPDLHALDQHLDAWSRRLHQSLHAADVFTPIEARDQARQALALAALRQQQLLCALREGPFGALEVGQKLDQHLRRHCGSDSSARWYPGRAVIITRNNASAGLYNGDVGLCVQLRDAQGHTSPQVLFEPASANQGPRHFRPDALPAHETAFALTVHKSQGSEYQRVALLLPPVTEHLLLSRQMLYTAASRAREQLELWAETSSLHACLDNPLQRAGRLALRL